MSAARYIWRSPWQVVVGGRDVTRHVDQLTYSNVDPGGFEACAITLADPIEAPRAGDRITIRHGLEVAWDGRVNDPGNADRRGRIVEQISGVGYGAILKDQKYREVYRDIDLTRWRGPSVQREINILAVSIDLNAGQSTLDTDSGDPSLTLELRSPWSRSAQCEMWWDAGGIEIGSVDYAGKTDFNIAGDALWDLNLYTADDDVATNLAGTSDLAGATTWGPATHTASSGHAAAYVRMIYNAAVTSDSNVARRAHWTLLAVHGTHGLTIRGSGTSAGLYPTDVAGHALYRANLGSDLGIVLGPVDTDANAYKIPHLAYYTPVECEQVIDDVIRGHLGWHWGVWESDGLHSTKPRLFLTKPPEEATCHVRRADLGDDFDAPRVRTDLLFDHVHVNYSDVAGRQTTVIVYLDNPLLDQAGIGDRAMIVDAGLSTAAAAQSFGTFALQLAQTAARGGGSATIPRDVSTASGSKPAALLKAGRDRLRITDLPDPGPLHESDTRRFDTFHVRRVETTVDREGVPQTRVELGTGADLLEVLQARAAAALVNVR